MQRACCVQKAFERDGDPVWLTAGRQAHGKEQMTVAHDVCVTEANDAVADPARSADRGAQRN